MSGTGLAPPGVSLSPVGGLTFAATGVGLSAATQTVTLTNNGGVALAVAGVTVSGDYAAQPGSRHLRLFSSTRGCVYVADRVCTGGNRYADRDCFI